MAPEAITQKIELPDGKVITIETGKLAKQAHGAVVVKMGKTMLLATIVSNEEAGENVDFLPLTVDYREKYYATGRFPGGFKKREGRNSDYEILICRLVDRALRPLFPEDYHSDTQLQISLISGDVNEQPDALACLAASAAIAVSNIPFNGPISEVRVARTNGKLQINPSVDEMEGADIDLIVAGSADSVVMVEGEMNEVSEKEMIEAIQFAHEVIKKQVAAINELAAKVESSKTKRVYNHETNDAELEEKIKSFAYDKCYAVAKEGTANKDIRKEKFDAIKEEFVATLPEEEAKEKSFLIGKYYHEVQKQAVRKAMLTERKRLDGREMTQVRPIWSEIDYLPGAHGSAIFTRGETQSLSSVTMGTKLDEQMIDGAVFKGYEKLLLHYNFPSFSTGESRPNRGPGRREIGHGNLALRALKPMIPAGEENPYTIRIVSDILESNGSSSMATVCAGTLALMDAGVKMKKPVSGIAMGLISDEKTGEYAILSDILGDEDHLGDMDFKVTGTRDGITACQMDIKIKGLSAELLEEALMQAHEGRMHILSEMEKTIAQPREDYKPHVPRIIQITIPKDMIGAVIGPGGKVIQDIQATTNTTITIEEEENAGIVYIASVNKEDSQAALERVKGIVTVPEEGEIYKGKVVRLADFGAFVDILPGKTGLLHISEISNERVNKVEDVLKEGDIIEVKLLSVDKRSGKLKLSRKVLLKEEAKAKAGE